LLDCDQSNILLERINFSRWPILFLSAFSFLSAHGDHASIGHRYEYNGVTILTFWSYVTSSVTWTFDSRWATSYGWSIVTMGLSGTVMEMWPFEVLLERLFQEQKSVGRSLVGRQYYTNIIYIVLLFATLGTQRARSKNRTEAVLMLYIMKRTPNT